MRHTVTITFAIVAFFGQFLSLQHVQAATLSRTHFHQVKKVTPSLLKSFVESETTNTFIEEREDREKEWKNSLPYISDGTVTLVTNRQEKNPSSLAKTTDIDYSSHLILWEKMNTSQ